MEKEIFVVVVVKDKNGYESMFANNSDNIGYGKTFKEAVDRLIDIDCPETRFMD